MTPNEYRKMPVKVEINSSKRMEGSQMKAHKFWAWAAAFCMLMVMVTGYKHK